MVVLAQLRGHYGIDKVQALAMWQSRAVAGRMYRAQLVLDRVDVLAVQEARRAAGMTQSRHNSAAGANQGAL